MRAPSTTSLCNTSIGSRAAPLHKPGGLSIIHLCIILLVLIEYVRSSGIQVHVSQIHGVLGRSATLRCSYRPISVGVYMVLWRREKQFDAVYYYMRASRTKRYDRPEGVLRKRRVKGKLNTGAGYHDLKFENPVTSDQIRYTCEVFAKKNNSEWYGIGKGSMDLIDPPNKPPEMRVESGDLLTVSCPADTENIPKVPVINKNRNWFIITCQAYPSKPEADITWIHSITSEYISEAEKVNYMYRWKRSTANITFVSGQTDRIVRCRVKAPDLAGKNTSTELCVKATFPQEQATAVTNWIHIIAYASAAFVGLLIVIVVTILLYRRKKRGTKV